MAEYATRLESGVDTAPRLRIADALSKAPNAEALGARSGVRGNGGVVTVSAGTMQVNVAPFAGWVDGGSSMLQGGYPVVLDASKAVTLDDGHATLDRVDTIAVVIHDDAFDGSGDTDCTVTVVTGTPGGGAPTLPDACLPLRDVNVPHGLSAGTGGLASGNLAADRRTFLAALGGLLPVASATERDALTPYEGMPVYRTDTSCIEVWNGASWDTYTNANDSGWQFYTNAAFGTGAVPNTDTIPTVASEARKIGNRADLHMEFLSSTYSNAGTGNVSDVTLVTLPTGLRPAVQQHVWISSTKAGGAGLIKTNGDVVLRTLYAPGIDTGDTIFVSASYLTD